MSVAPENVSPTLPPPLSPKAPSQHPPQTMSPSSQAMNHIRNVYHIGRRALPVDLFLSVVGDAQFVIGSSLILVPSTVNLGVCIFAMGSVFCGLAGLWFAVRSFYERDLVVSTSQISSFLGNLAFAVCSVTYLRVSWRDASLWGFLAASVLFLVTAVILAVVCCITMSPLVLLAFLIPSYAFNLLGACTFVVGSAFLLHEPLYQAGAWLYVAGSAFYLLGACGDVVAFLLVRRRAGDGGILTDDNETRPLVSADAKRP